MPRLNFRTNGRRERMPDFTITNHGNIYLLTPRKPRATGWINEHLQLEGWQWFGPSAVIDQHYIGTIIDAIRNDGLSWRGVL